MPKISALPPMVTAEAADEAPIVDTSATTTKKWTLTLLKSYLQSLTAWITSAMMDAGAVIQTASTNVNAVATGTTIMPFDDTIPQNTEGDQYMTLAITPKHATSKLVIFVTAFFSHSAANGQVGVALFRDSTANALAVTEHYENTATGVINVTFSFDVAAAAAVATTFKVRIGSQNAGTLTFNGQSGGRRYGGVAASSMRILEVKQ